MLIPNTDSPAPAERIAVLDTRLLPGRDSIMDWAFFFGSSAGTFEAYRCGLENVGRTRVEKVGRRRRLPVRSSIPENCIDNTKAWNLPMVALVNREIMMAENAMRRFEDQIVLYNLADEDLR